MQSARTCMANPASLLLNAQLPAKRSQSINKTVSSSPHLLVSILACPFMDLPVIVISGVPNSNDYAQNRVL
eukprot:scaffold80032_cov20-Tisochrysis_lutea.AAC.1